MPTPCYGPESPNWLDGWRLLQPVSQLNSWRLVRPTAGRPTDSPAACGRSRTPTDSPGGWRVEPDAD
jgi:hypothetical protein